MSRGPTLALGSTLYLTAALRRPRWRWPMLAAVLIMGTLAVWQRNLVLDALHVWSTEAAHIRKHGFTKVIIDGKPVEYSGTMHRILMWEVYSNAMQRAGWIGFGTDRTSEFPPRIPLGPTDVQTLKRLSFVDNEYILLDLRFGLIAVICFIVAGLSVVAYFMLGALHQPAENSLFLASMGAMVLSVMLILLTVWLPHDFGFALIWTMGIGSGLRSAWQRGYRAEGSQGKSKWRVPLPFPSSPPTANGHGQGGC